MDIFTTASTVQVQGPAVVPTIAFALSRKMSTSLKGKEQLSVIMKISLTLKTL